MINELPTHEESKLAIDAGEDTALHRFIHENEPAGENSEKLFRLSLLAVVIGAQREGLAWQAENIKTIRDEHDGRN